MNYKEAKEYMKETEKMGSILGLTAIKELLKRLENPQKELEFIHIAGTNGKGSVLAFISSILKCSGYKTGRYSSPVVFSYREKIQVNGAPIEKEEFAECVTEIGREVEKMKKEGLSSPTSFEIETALAFLYFKKKRCDIVILETGLGGRLDATNVIKNTICAVFTPITMDHMEVLGDTIEEIAKNKAGIIKPGASVITARQCEQVMEVLKKEGELSGCQLSAAGKAVINSDSNYDKQIFSYGELKDLEISLAGTYQVENAVLALETIKALNKKTYVISEDSIRKGLRETEWQGRFSILSTEPVMIADGAHNPDAVRRLRESIETYFPGRKVVFIMGVFQDKAYEKMISIVSPLALHFITVTPGNKRGLEASCLAQVIGKYDIQAVAAEDVKDAVSKALHYAGSEGIVVAFGSLSYLSEIVKVVTDMVPEEGVL